MKSSPIMIAGRTRGRLARPMPKTVAMMRGRAQDPGAARRSGKEMKEEKPVLVIFGRAMRLSRGDLELASNFEGILHFFVKKLALF